MVRNSDAVSSTAQEGTQTLVTGKAGKLSHKHERFCQGIAEGMAGVDAYIFAGYECSAAIARNSASRLLANDSIKARVAELLEKRRQIDAQATEIAIQKLAITKERVLSELAKIGFSDIRKVVRWNGQKLKDGEVVSNDVSLICSDEIDDDTAAAISEISQSPTGGLKVKLHDKKGALVDIGKQLGMFKEVHEHTGKDGGPIDNRHHHTVDPVSAFDGFLAEAAGGRAEGDTEKPLPN